MAGGEARPAVDLRSDTVTRPSPGMREAIAAAEVGDDALGDDPTTRRLEERVAELLGKERALFFPSGVMANQAALAALGRWGGEVLCDDGAHVFHYEEGAAAALSGLQLRPVPTDGGLLEPRALADAVRAESPYLPVPCAVVLENTHLASGGRVLPVERARRLRDVAADRGLPVHLDGARLWHACAATGEPPDAWGRLADTVMVALSKGLGAPVGSVLAGTDEVIGRAWRIRRRLGGGMRQSGILAAAGLYALEHHRDGLAGDHERARALAALFDRVPGLRAETPETNIVLVGATDSGTDLTDLVDHLAGSGVLMLRFGTSHVRGVTHRDIGEGDLQRVAEALRRWPGNDEDTRRMA